MGGNCSACHEETHADEVIDTREAPLKKLDQAEAIASLDSSVPRTRALSRSARDRSDSLDGTDSRAHLRGRWAGGPGDPICLAPPPEVGDQLRGVVESRLQALEDGAKERAMAGIENLQRELEALEAQKHMTTAWGLPSPPQPYMVPSPLASFVPPVSATYPGAQGYPQAPPSFMPPMGVPEERHHFSDRVSQLQGLMPASNLPESRSSDGIPARGPEVHQLRQAASQALSMLGTNLATRAASESDSDCDHLADRWRVPAMVDSYGREHGSLVPPPRKQHDRYYESNGHNYGAPGRYY